MSFVSSDRTSLSASSPGSTVDYGRVDSSGEPLGGAFAPFTSRIWFIEAPYESAVEATRLWRNGLETPSRFEPVSGGIDDLLGCLEPWAMPSWKQLVVETSGAWTALFSQGSDIYTFEVIGESLRCRSVRTNHESDVRRHGRVVNYGDTALWLSDGSRDDLAPLFSVRIIQASNQDGWEWDLSGEPQPFEEPERYRRRVIKERFDLPTLNRYCQALGIDRATPRSYGPSATLITEDTSGWPGKPRTMTSQQWRSEHS